MLIKVKREIHRRAPSRGLVNENLAALPQVLKLIGSPQLTPALEDEIIRLARYYARVNKLAMPTDLNGAIRLMEEAHETVRGYVAAYTKAMDDNPQNRSTGRNRKIVTVGGDSW